MRSESFSVGEIAILRHCENHPEYEGTDCAIVDPLTEKMVHEARTGVLEIRMAYGIRAHDGRLFAAQPHHLQKKKPPPVREQTSTWDDVIVWRPKETANV